MKAVAVFPDKREVRIVDHPEPTLSSPTELKIRILEVGICGSDKEIVSFQYGTPPEGSEYLIIGHESLGEVVETGAHVQRFRQGDLVVLTVRRPCPHDWCLACRRGRQDFCYSGDFTERGIKGRHGFMTELVVEDQQYVHRVPKELRDVAVMTEPLTIAEKSIDELWKVQERLPWDCTHAKEKGRGHCHRAVVLGAGPVGLLGAMALKVVGFDTTVYSRTQSHRDKDAIVTGIGARFIAAEDHTVEQMASKVGNIDVVYEAIGASNVAFDVLKHLGPNATFIFTGVPGRKAPIPVDTDCIMRNLVLKNQLVMGSVNAPAAAFQSAIRDLGTFRQRWPEALKLLITARFALADALKPLQDEHVGGIKNVIAVAS